MIAKNLSQGRLQEMRGGMVATSGISFLYRHFQVSSISCIDRTINYRGPVDDEVGEGAKRRQYRQMRTAGGDSPVSPI